MVTDGRCNCITGREGKEACDVAFASARIKGETAFDGCLGHSVV